MSRIPIAAQQDGITIHAMETGANRIPHPTEHAVAVCRSIWQTSFETARKEGHSLARSRRIAGIAYRIALPLLTDRDSIRAHIACVAQGVNLEVYSGRDAGQLLYAAQVALSLLKEPSK